MSNDILLLSSLPFFCFPSSLLVLPFLSRFLHFYLPSNVLSLIYDNLISPFFLIPCLLSSILPSCAVPTYRKSEFNGWHSWFGILEILGSILGPEANYPDIFGFPQYLHENSVTVFFFQIGHKRYISHSSPFIIHNHPPIRSVNKSAEKFG